MNLSAFIYQVLPLVKGVAFGCFVWWAFWPKRFVVPHNYVAARYRDGRFLGIVPAGRYWTRRRDTTLFTLVDTRSQIFDVSGQGVVVKDNLSVKISFFAYYEVTDAEKALHLVENYQRTLYLALQMSLRRVVAEYTWDELIPSRVQLGAQVLAGVLEPAEQIGVIVSAVEIKDIILPTALKKAHADIVIAKKAAEASLERARGETATLRHLANAAKMLDNNPNLLQLRYLESIDAAATAGGNTLVLGQLDNKTPRGGSS